MAKRRRFTADFKARVVMEAMRGSRTARQIAARHGVRPNQVRLWKRQVEEGLPDLFQRGGTQGRNGALEADLREAHAKIAQLVVERDFLKKVLGR